MPKGQDGAETWILVMRAETGEVPIAVRVRQVIKYACRRHGLRVVAMPNDLPTTARTEAVVTIADVLEEEERDRE